MLSGCGPNADPKPDTLDEPCMLPEGRATPIVALLANPEAFQDKEVLVVGLYVAGFEESAIYPSKEMALSQGNGIWINLNTPLAVGDHPGSKHWMMFKGVFNARHHGHLGAYAGALAKISISRNLDSLYAIEVLDEKPSQPRP
jgi:hypothetical protein